MNKKNKFEDEIRTLKNISTLLDRLYLEDVEALEEMIKTNSFKIAVIGGFSSGKTTFLNAFIGRRLLYSSAKEATGAITFIQNSSEKKAIVEFENGNSKNVDLKEDNAYEVLLEYLNRNSSNKAKSISLYYPIDRIDKDVILVDTPGLEGISKEEMNITKSLVKEANAVIFMVKHNGLDKNDLDVLTGRLAEFGNIQTKEIYLVINKIGELYKTKNTDEIDKRVERIICDVQKNLYDNGISNIKVYALDSKDYLWAVDNKLYEEVKAKEKMEKILPQDEYLKRSARFIEFRDTLKNLLQDSNKERMFNENIKERINTFVKIFSEELIERQNNYNSNINQNIYELERQKDFIIENRRKIINTIKRQIEENKLNFIEALKNDSVKERKAKDRNLLDLIQKEFKNIEDLQNNKNINELIKNSEQIIYDYKDIILNRSNLFLDSLSQISSSIFNMEINKIFDRELKYEFNIKAENINMDFTFKYNHNTDNDMKKQLEDDVEKQKEYIIQLRRELNNLTSENNENEEIRIKSELKKIENEKENKINNLGTKPKPSQKYRSERRVRRKFLIFKEEYSVEVPDGLDYTKCEEWEKNKAIIDKEFNEKQSQLSSKLDMIIEKSQKAKRLKISIAEEDNMLLSLEDSLKKYNINMKNIREKYKYAFIDEKKNDLFVFAQNILKSNINNIMTIIEDRINENIKTINFEIEKQSSSIINDTENILNMKIKEFREKQNIVKIDENYVIDEFNKLKYKYGEE